MLDNYTEITEEGTIIIKLPLERDFVNTLLGRCKTTEEYEAADKDVASPPMGDAEWERFHTGVNWPALVAEIVWSADSYFAIERVFEQLTRPYVVKAYRVRNRRAERSRAFATREEAEAYVHVAQQEGETDEYEWTVVER